jgi:MFS family permease
MTFRQFKSRVFFLEACNAFAAALYFNYIFFYLRTRFGIGSAGNLLFCSLNGFVYMFAAWYGGHYGQKRGYFAALRLGIAIMIAALLAASALENLKLQVVGMIVWTLGICFTWPTLEALTSEGENRQSLPKMIGIYNVVWAGGVALAYFTGGALVEKLGWKCIFWIPVGLHLIQFALLPSMEKTALWNLSIEPSMEQYLEKHNPPETKYFLKLAWIANPFAYVAMNTAIPLIPDLAARLRLSPAMAGIFGSIWMFSRLGTFVILGYWPAWHYRFGLLVSSYVMLVATFAGLLLFQNIWAILIDQVIFGLSAGLIYYSSLYYSMDAGDEKGSHGGFHEAAIGAGIFAGPAMGFTAQHLFPGNKTSSIWAVTSLLAIGLAALLSLRKPSRRELRNAG